MQTDRTGCGVFISYSRREAQWLERIQVHLRPHSRDHSLDVWDDTRIPSGARWYDEIRAALQRARVAIFLVSADFLASEFIHREELPPLLKAAEEGGVRILCVVLSPCAFQVSPLEPYQTVNPPDRPIVELPFGEQERMFVTLAAAVRQEAEAARLAAPSRSVAPVGPAPVRAVAPASARVELRDEWIYAGEFDRAAEAAGRTLEADPDDVEALLLRARAVLHQQDWPAESVVRDAARALIRAAPENVAAAAHALLLLDHPKLARERLTQALATRPHDPRLLRLRMRAAVAAHAPREAIRDADALLAADPEDGPTWHARAQACYAQKAWEDAIRCATRAIERMPRYWPAHECRGWAHVGAGRTPDALEDLARVLDLAPWHAASRRCRAALLLDGKRYLEALSELTAGLVLAPRDGSLRAMRARCHRYLDSWSLARSDALAALDVDPEQADAREVLAELDRPAERATAAPR